MIIVNRVPVNRSAAIVTNQSGCDDALTELLLERQVLSEAQDKIKTALAGRGLASKHRETLRRLETKQMRRLQEIAEQLKSLGLDAEYVTMRKRCKTRAHLFQEVAARMLSEPIYQAIAAQVDELWPESRG